MAGQWIDIAARDGGVIFLVRVQPRASRDEVAGVIEGALKLRIQAPAVENRANEANSGRSAASDAHPNPQKSPNGPHLHGTLT